MTDPVPNQLGTKLEKATSIQMAYIERQRKKTLEKGIDMMKTRHSNIKFALGLTGLVFCIYGYTLNAIKQETFLDNLDDPADFK